MTGKLVERTHAIDTEAAQNQERTFWERPKAPSQSTGEQERRPPAFPEDE